MLPHQQRVLDEHAELSKKLESLRAFFGTETAGSLAAAEHNLLKRQERIMTEYVAVLELRIKFFNIQ